MTDDAFALLRCPLDPRRESPLERVRQELHCTCGTKFPVVKGVPVFLADHAELPCERKQLPCRHER